ncbi:hypothetical protein SAMN05216326_13223 [Nitrosomonas marina]|uniref:von Willebrand factor type A domain-containing protein n=1 Tax=Nitrosomonas marina TaxID=917 RepID=A0A1I0F474_9PROT|nr:choice-of-anchor X domain-containing protein [Nitrosomonas marina]SET51838.1 hypothetical protein SAMN05216326_13223 [Nitrosomonas marina]
MISRKWIIYSLLTVATLLSWYNTVVLADGVDVIAAKRDLFGTVDLSVGSSEYVVTENFDNGKGIFRIQTYRPVIGNEEIQFYFEINDSHVDPDNDQIRIRLDLNHDHANTPNIDKAIVIYRQLSGAATNRVRVADLNLVGEPVNNAVDLPSGQWMIDDGSDAGDTTWIAEVKVTAADLGFGYIPSIIGLHIRVLTNNESPTAGVFPPGISSAAIASWANLKTRNPINYALVLDRSGSMEDSIDGSTKNFERWNSAIIASEIFSQLYFAMRSPYFNDKIGVVTYTTASGGFFSCSGATPQSSLIGGSLQNLSSISVDGFVTSTLGSLQPTGCTPIKDGLNTAFAGLDDGDAERIALLLSDGFHNVPSTNYDATPYVFPGSLTQSDFEVNTVVLENEPDTGADTNLMQDISNDFGGFASAYINAVSKEELVAAFVENLFGHLYLNQTQFNGTAQFTVNNNEPRLVVMLVWHSTVASDRGFRLQRPDNSIIDTTDSSYHHFRDTTLGYELAYYVVDNPPAGTWQSIGLVSNTAEVADNNLAIFDPTIYAQFNAKRQGQDILLQVSLQENGKPITEPDAEVTMGVERPDEGLGTFASTFTSKCQSVPPNIPPIINVRDIISGKNPPAGNIVITSQPAGSTSFATTTTVNPNTTSMAAVTNGDQNRLTDTLPPHMIKVQRLLEICEKDGFNRSENNLKLYDDGSHGDATAGDGIFSLLYQDADKEGTYNFAFLAKGKAPSGSEFTRQKNLSYHKSVIVDSTTTAFDSRVISVTDKLVHKEYYIVPMDNKHEYLGPGHAPEVKFFVTGAIPIGQTIDYNNGFYSQVVAYDPAAGEPIVTPVVQGTPIQGKCDVQCPLPNWIWWLIAVLTLIILLLFRLCMLRKNKP